MQVDGGDTSAGVTSMEVDVVETQCVSPVSPDASLVVRHNTLIMSSPSTPQRGSIQHTGLTGNDNHIYARLEFSPF